MGMLNEVWNKFVVRNDILPCCNVYLDKKTNLWKKTNNVQADFKWDTNHLQKHLYAQPWDDLKIPSLYGRRVVMGTQSLDSDANCKWIMRDYDKHSPTDPDPINEVIEDYNRIVDFGLIPVVFTSSGGSGYHVYILFDAPVKTEEIWLFAECWKAQAKSKDRKKLVEINPRRPFLSQNGNSPVVYLPLAAQSRYVTIEDEFAWEEELEDDFIFPTNAKEKVLEAAEQWEKHLGKTKTTTTIRTYNSIDKEIKNLSDTSWLIQHIRKRLSCIDYLKKYRKLNLMHGESCDCVYHDVNGGNSFKIIEDRINDRAICHSFRCPIYKHSANRYSDDQGSNIDAGRGGIGLETLISMDFDLYENDDLKFGDEIENHEQYFQRMQQLYNWACDNGYMPKNKIILKRRIKKMKTVNLTEITCRGTKLMSDGEHRVIISEVSGFADDLQTYFLLTLKNKDQESVTKRLVQGSYGLTVFAQACGFSDKQIEDGFNPLDFRGKKLFVEVEQNEKDNKTYANVVGFRPDEPDKKTPDEEMREIDEKIDKTIDEMLEAEKQKETTPQNEDELKNILGELGETLDGGAF